MPESRRRRRGGQVVPRGARSAGSLSDARPRRKKTNKLYLAASAIVAILVIAGFAVGGIPLGGGGNQGAQAGRYGEYQDGIGIKQDLMPTLNHVPDTQTVDYNTTPPTSGDHWDFWARCGFYEDGMPDERIVHNMEHGNIIVSYNLPNQADVERLREFMGGLDLATSWAVTRFYDQIDEGTVALTTWGVLDTMQGVDEDRIERFFDAYAGRLGPEFDDGAPCEFTGIMN